MFKTEQGFAKTALIVVTWAWVKPPQTNRNNENNFAFIIKIFKSNFKTKIPLVIKRLELFTLHGIYEYEQEKTCHKQELS